MIVPSTIAYFIPIALIILLLPGPAVVFITTRSVSYGRRIGLLSVLGIELGNLTIAIVAAMGLAFILLESALAFNVVKYLGAGYLIYLGIRTILTRGSEGPQPARPNGKNVTGSRALTSSYIVGVLNPKTIIFFYAFLPQFVVPGAGSAAIQILFFGIVFVLMGLCTDSAYAALSSGARSALTRKLPNLKGRLRYFSAAAYIALGITTASSSPHSGL